MIVHMEDNSVHEWDLTTREKTRSWPPAAGRYTGAFSPDGTWYLTSILNPDTKTVTSLIELNSGRETNLNLPWYYAASFSADGRLFALGGWRPEVRLFETATAKEISKTKKVAKNVAEICKDIRIETARATDAGVAEPVIVRALLGIT